MLLCCEVLEADFLILIGQLASGGTGNIFPVERGHGAGSLSKVLQAAAGGFLELIVHSKGTHRVVFSLGIPKELEPQGIRTILMFHSLAEVDLPKVNSS